MQEISKLWIDTDPGIDDALTLIAASLGDEYEIVGISSVNGNVDVETGKNNICKICEIVGIDIPVYVGESKSLSENTETNGKYGTSGLGYFINDDKYDNYGEVVSEGLYFTAKESQKLDILVLGPATNIADTILKYPDIVDYLGNIFVMGGTLNSGNITANTEFNLYKDPKAFNILLENNLNIFLFSLDLTSKFGLSKDELMDLNKKDTDYKELLADMIDFLVDERFSHDDEIYLHDIFTLYGYIYKDGVIYEEIKVKAIEGDYERGKLIPDESGKEVYYAVKLNEENFKNYIKEIFS